MNEEEKIIRLLTKDTISDQELTELNRISEDNPHVKKLIYIQSTIDKVVKKVHPGIELISEYILYLNKQYDKEYEFQKLHFKMEEHISSCEKCKKIFQELSEEYNNIGDFVAGNNILTNDQIIDTPLKPLSKIYYSAYSFAAAAIIILAMILFDNITKSPVIEFAESIAFENNYQTRNISDEEYLKTFNAMSEDDYETAIIQFEQYINKTPADETSFYDQFTLGKLYLLDAQSSIWGMFCSIDKGKLLSSINAFNKSILLNQSHKFSNVNSDSRFYLGVCFSLLGEKDKSKLHLSKVISEGGQFKQKAIDLINILDE